MSEVGSTTQELARQLLREEAGGRQEPAALAEAIERLSGRLRRRIGTLVGQTGFAVLFTRALHLAQRSHPALAGITFDGTSAGGLRGAREFAAASAPEAVDEGLATILAQFIGLLTTFIGEELGMRLIHEIWPVPGLTASPVDDAEAHV